MLKKLLILLSVLLISSFYIHLNAQSDLNQSQTANHELQKLQKDENHADCDGHGDHDENDHNEIGNHDDVEENHDHENHDEGFFIKLTSDVIKLAGITFQDVKHGCIDRTIELPGEIGFNEDRLAHISPRFAGVALKANIRVGDYVKKGDIVAVVESNESMNSYSIKAPISGWVIERHLTPGEFVSEENSIFVIADLSTVWVNLAVYPKDANRIRMGQTTRFIRLL